MHPNTDTILTLFREGRLLRHQWGGKDAEGRLRVCLLAALAPKCAEVEDWTVCPASVMPQWLAALTPDMDDLVSDSIWANMVRRYADLAGRWQVLREADWRDLHLVTLRIMVSKARTVAYKRHEAGFADLIGLIERMRTDEYVPLRPSLEGLIGALEIEEETPLVNYHTGNVCSRSGEAAKRCAECVIIALRSLDSHRTEQAFTFATDRSGHFENPADQITLDILAAIEAKIDDVVSHETAEPVEVQVLEPA